jgi:aminopeptidase
LNDLLWEKESTHTLNTGHLWRKGKFLENQSGAVHRELGRAYEECGGANQSQIHWDIVLDLREGGQLILDGELVQENGGRLI